MTPLQEILRILDYMKRSHLTLQDRDVITILKATREVTENKELVNNMIFLYRRFEKRKIDPSRVLTNRELQVLHLVGLGKENSTIARKLRIRPATVETHRKHIRKKLKLRGKGSLLQYAIIHNLRQGIDNMY